MSRADLDAERALFEAWYKKEFPESSLYTKRGSHQSLCLQAKKYLSLWRSMQAALASQAPAVQHLERHVEQLKAKNAGLEAIIDVMRRERENCPFCAAPSLQGDAEDAARYRWLLERFTGYDFYWGGKPDAETKEGKGKIVAVINVGETFRGGHNLSAAIDAARKAVPLV